MSLLHEIKAAPLEAEPWPHLAVDLSVPAATLRQEWPNYQGAGWTTLRGASVAWRHMREELGSREFRNMLLDRFGGVMQPELLEPASYYKTLPHKHHDERDQTTLSIKTDQPFTFTRADIRRDSNGYGIKPHLDRPRRLFSILVYLGGWRLLAGGLLKLHGRPHKYIEPHEGLAIIYPRLRRSVHSVTPVEAIDGQRHFVYLGITVTNYPWRYPCTS